jgi:hypothetical protein
MQCEREWWHMTPIHITRILVAHIVNSWERKESAKCHWHDLGGRQLRYQ